jgi:hypothetical protein
VKEAVRRLVKQVCICGLISGLSGLGCAGIPQREQNMAGELCAVKQQFAGGQYRQSLQGCRTIMDSRPGCPPLDEALYYAALNSLRMDPGEIGRLQAGPYFKRLVDACPTSPLRPEAEAWLAVLTPSPDKAGNGNAQPGVDAGSTLAGHEGSPQHNGLKKKDQEIKRLRSEIVRLHREIDMLKNVDVQLHQQTKDLDNGPDEGKNTRP